MLDVLTAENQLLRSNGDLHIEGVLIIVPRLFRDARGYFFESFSEREFEEKA